MNRHELMRHAERYGLTVTTYAPGDGVTRYRFARGDGAGNYFSARAIHTALGLGEASRWLEAYAAGYRDGSAVTT